MINQINEDLKNAMKEKDTFKLSVLRMLKSALQLEGIAKKSELTDNDCIAVIKKQVKLRKDSVLEYEKYGKTESVESLNKEIEVLNAYLPEELSEADLVSLIDKIIASVGATSMKDMGKVMGALNAELAGKNADMSLASKLVKEKLNMKKEEEFEEKELGSNNKKGIFTQEQIFNEYEKLMKKNFEKNKQDKTKFLSYMYPDNNLQIVLTPSKDNAQGFKMEIFYGEGSKKIDLYKEFLKK